MLDNLLLLASIFINFFLIFFYIKRLTNKSKTIENLPINVKRNMIVDFLTKNGRYRDELNDEDTSHIYVKYLHNVFKDNMNSCIYAHYAFYQQIKKNYNETIKYYLLAIDLGNVNVIVKLGQYYRMIKDYGNMKKYLLMAIEKRSTAATVDLINYYADIKDYNNMKKYYFIGIENNANMTFDGLLQYIFDFKDYDTFYKLFEIKPSLFDDEEYIHKIIEIAEKSVDNEKSIEILNYINIQHFQVGKVSPIVILCKKLLNKKIELLDLHFKYAPESNGYLQAKKDFIQQLTI